MEELFDSPTLSDATIRVKINGQLFCKADQKTRKRKHEEESEPKVFRVSKLVVSAAMPFLEKKFTTSESNNIEVDYPVTEDPDIAITAFEIVLRYAYGQRWFKELHGIKGNKMVLLIACLGLTDYLGFSEAGDRMKEELSGVDVTEYKELETMVRARDRFCPDTRLRKCEEFLRKRFLPPLTEVSETYLLVLLQSCVNFYETACSWSLALDWLVENKRTDSEINVKNIISAVNLDDIRGGFLIKVMRDCATFKYLFSFQKKVLEIYCRNKDFNLPSWFSCVPEFLSTDIKMSKSGTISIYGTKIHIVRVDTTNEMILSVDKQDMLLLKQFKMTLSINNGNIFPHVLCSFLNEGDVCHQTLLLNPKLPDSDILVKVSNIERNPSV